MGYKLSSFEFSTDYNEPIERKIVLQRENRSIIHGVVLDENDKPVKNAVIRLFELANLDEYSKIISITHGLTDDCGQFIFGPLQPCRHYIVKMWYDAAFIKHTHE